MGDLILVKKITKSNKTKTKMIFDVGVSVRVYEYEGRLLYYNPSCKFNIT